VPAGRRGRQFHRQHPRHSQLLRGHALKLVIDDIDRVDFRAAEHVHRPARNGGGVVIGGLVGQADRFARNRSVAFAEEIAALAANQLQLDGSLGTLLDEALRAFDEVRIEGAGEAFVGAEYQQQDVVLLAAGEQLVLAGQVVERRGRGYVGQHAAQHTAVWTRPDDAILRAAQLGRRDHLHGLGDLLRVLDRADAPPDVDQARHAPVPRFSDRPRTAP